MTCCDKNGRLVLGLYIQCCICGVSVIYEKKEGPTAA